nr:MAG TPA: hypothetical protein [Caudoviricetes sp.]
MKTQEQICQKIKELKNDTNLLKNMMKNSTDPEIKFDCIKSIFKIQKIQREIRLLQWVLEG